MANETLSEVEKRELRGAKQVYEARYQRQLQELREIDFVIAHLIEQIRLDDPWEADQQKTVRVIH